MDKKAAWVLLGILGISLVCLLLFSDDAWARAGKLPGSGRWRWYSFVLYLVFLPVIVIYSMIMTLMVRNRNRQAKALLKRIEALDDSWNIEHMKHRVREVFFKVQYAWRDRDQEIARDYMSARLYEIHKLQTDDMIRRGVRNVMERISLSEAKVVEVLDYEDDSRDTFWVLIKGGMIDYLVHEKTGAVAEGERQYDTF